MIFFSIFLFLATISKLFLFTFQQSLIQFDKPSSYNDLYFTVEVSDIKIHAGSSSKTVVVINHISSDSLKLQYICTIKELNEAYLINKMEFCKINSNDFTETCLIVKNEINFIPDWTWRVVKDDYIGANFTIDLQAAMWKVSRSSLSGHYFCRLSNEQSTVNGSTLEIRDIYHPYLKSINNKKSKKFVYKKILNYSMIPIYIDCPLITPKIPLNLDEMFTLRPFVVQWAICRFENGNCDTRSKIPLNKFISDYIELDNGTILIRELFKIKFKDNALFCYNNFEESGELEFFENDNSETILIDGQPQLEPENIQKLTPINLVDSIDLELQEGKRLSDFKLFPLFRSPNQANTINWLHNGAPISENLFPNAFKDSKNYSLNFGDTITQSHAGLYKAIVINSFTNENITFKWNVSVVSAPVFLIDMPENHFVVAGFHQKINFTFSGSNQNNLLINGWDLTNFQSKYPEVDFSTDFKDDHISVDIKIPDNVQETNRLSNILSCAIRNKLGVSQSFTRIQFLPQKLLISGIQSITCNSTCSFEDKNCTHDCPLERPQKFNVTINEVAAENVKLANLFIRIHWFLNDTLVSKNSQNDLSLIFKFFNFSQDNQHLTIESMVDEISNDENLREMFQYPFILSVVASIWDSEASDSNLMTGYSLRNLHNRTIIPGLIFSGQRVSVGSSNLAPASDNIILNLNPTILLVTASFAKWILLVCLILLLIIILILLLLFLKCRTIRKPSTTKGKSSPLLNPQTPQENNKPFFDDKSAPNPIYKPAYDNMRNPNIFEEPDFDGYSDNGSYNHVYVNS